MGEYKFSNDALWAGAFYVVKNAEKIGLRLYHCIK